MDDEGRLDRRLGIHGSLSARLAGLSDQQLIGLLGTGTSWHAHIHGNQSGVVEIEGAKVFVKKIALTNLERENEGATANLFGLPGFYQYGVGSAGFGAWRELAAYLKASAWALSGEHSGFPLVYHWRVLPRPQRPQLTKRQLDWLKTAPAYWGGSDAVRARLEAIAAASATLVLFLEYVPQTLHAWLGESLAGPSLDAAEDGILRLYEQVQDTATFMNARACCTSTCTPSMCSPMGSGRMWRTSGWRSARTLTCRHPSAPSSKLTASMIEGAWPGTSSSSLGRRMDQP